MRFKSNHNYVLTISHNISNQMCANAATLALTHKRADRAEAKASPAPRTPMPVAEESVADIALFVMSR